MSPAPSNLPASHRIPARSRQQAMDWSLVLASQGIEHVLDQTEETGWSLVVSEADHPTAIAAIRQYRLESRHWPWQRTIPRTDEVFDWFATAWVVLTLVFYWFSSQRPTIEGAGIVDGAAVASGQWWRLFTATQLHANLPHLAANAGFGFLLLGLAMGRYGTGVGLLSAFLAGVGGNVVSWMVHGKTFQGLGASGVVMGALGLITVPVLARTRNRPQTLRLLLVSVAAGIMLFVLLGVAPGSDVVAHLGGFITGVALAILLSLGSRVFPGLPANLIGGLLFACLILWTWWLALHRSV